jgi:hypothetical protein
MFMSVVLSFTLKLKGKGWYHDCKEIKDNEVWPVLISCCNVCSREGAESVLGMKVDEEERAQLLEEQKAYDREEMNTERIMSTRNKILDFWQTLE